MEAAVEPAAWITTGATNSLPCAYALWLTGRNIDSTPKAAMTVERIGSFIAACFSLQAVEG
jgi:hypothetical protein